MESMRGELAALQPELAAKAAATAELLGRVDMDQAEAEKVKAVVEVEEADVKNMQQATQVGWSAAGQATTCFGGASVSNTVHDGLWYTTS